nr:MAG TPA: hypothetical protein [Caudoviricetes sp.]
MIRFVSDTFNIHDTLRIVNRFLLFFVSFLFYRYYLYLSGVNIYL